MSVSRDDVRHVARLARLSLDDARADAIAVELTGILDHMEVLAGVDTEGVAPVAGIGASGTPLRVDAGPAIPLARTREEIAPEMRDGFFLVPRLASHEQSPEESE